MVPIREPKTYSILLADDLTLVREGLAALCEAQPQFRVVGQCSEGVAALRMMELQRPICAVLDLNLPRPIYDDWKLSGGPNEPNLPAKIVVPFHAPGSALAAQTVVEALTAHSVSAFLLKSGPSVQLLEAFRADSGRRDLRFRSWN